MSTKDHSPTLQGGRGEGPGAQSDLSAGLANRTREEVPEKRRQASKLNSSYFIKLLLEKKYGLPYRVVDAIVAHFMRFIEDTRVMPVIWHQSLLAFVQRYKNELRKEDKDDLRILLKRQKHKLVTPEIIRELDSSRNRGEKEDNLMLISRPISVINKTIEEDRFDIPDVPMEED
ncbi:bystin-like [Pistacia vera]|uniref:bystin-like n=1 Tax=Pistacia vera TaxID=55513 RepID=UPI0012634FFF|nr:bystin-like [Pistacia vera]